MQAGDAVAAVPTDGVQVPIVELMRLDRAEALDDAAALRLLAAPTHGDLRTCLQRRFGNRIDR